MRFCSLTVVFIARCYACAYYKPWAWVCQSQVGVLLKRLNMGSYKQHHTIVQGLSFFDAKDLRETRPGQTPAGAPNAGGVG